MAKHLALPADLHKALIEYLSQKPFAEVHIAIGALLQLKEVAASDDSGTDRGSLTGKPRADELLSPSE